MQHHFNTEIAQKYDITTAVFLDNFFFWTEKNRVNDKNFYDGRYWTYNTKKAMQEWFPYLNPRQIDYAIKKMIENGLLMQGNYNENKYDRTLWYAITDFGYSILQNCKMYNSIYTNTNTNTIKEIKKEKSVESTNTTDTDIQTWFDKVYGIYPRKVSKVQAKTTFVKKLKGLDKDTAYKKAVTIYRMLERQIQIWQNENDGQGRKIEHIPHLSSWLNNNVE